MISLDSSPGHKADDELMYGSGSGNLPTEDPAQEADHQSHASLSDTGNAATQSPGTATSNLAASARPQVQDNLSTTSTKSGVLGRSTEESRLMSETPSTSHPADSSQDPVPHPPGAHARDFATETESQPDAGSTQPKGLDRAAVGKTHTTEQGLARADDTSTKGTQSRSAETMPWQSSNANSNNPYSSAHLDPRVDPHAKRSSAETTSGTSASITSTGDPVGRAGDHGSSTESQALSGGKTMAERFDGPKGTSQPLSGPKGTSQPLSGPKGTSQPLSDPKGTAAPMSGPKGTSKHLSGPKDITETSDRAKGSSWPLKEEEPDQTSAGTMPGAFEVGNYHSASAGQSEVPSYGAGTHPVADRRSEPTQAEYSGAGTSGTSDPTDGRRKEQHGGILAATAGALGLGGYAAKKHAGDKPEHSATAASQEPMSTVTHASGTSPGDLHDTRAPTGNLTAPPRGSQDVRAAPSTEVSSQPPTTGAGTYEPSTAIGVTGLSTATPGYSTKDKQEGSHLGRDAVIGGAVAAGAGTVGSHEYSQYQSKKEEQERFESDKAHQQAMEESRKAAEKEHKAHEKALAKEEKKAEKEHEKAIKREEKELEKEHEKAIKHEEKRKQEHEKELARHEKEAEKPTDSEDKGKKHHGLLGLFHREKDTKGSDIEHEKNDHRADTTAVGAGVHKHGKYHEMNKLHKDPPPGLGYSGDSATPAYADYAVKEDDHPGAQTVTGGYTAPAPEHDINKLHKGPPHGHNHNEDSAKPAHTVGAVKGNDYRGVQAVTGGYPPPVPVHDMNKPQSLSHRDGSAAPGYTAGAVRETDHSVAQPTLGGYPASASEPGRDESAGYSGRAANPANVDYEASQSEEAGARTTTSTYTASSPEHDSHKHAGAGVGAGDGGTEAAHTGSVIDRPRGVYDIVTSPPASGDASKEGHANPAVGETDPTVPSGGHRGMSDNEYRSGSATDHPAPTSGYASQVTGGSGTTALAHGARGSTAADIAYEAMGGSSTTASSTQAGLAGGQPPHHNSKDMAGTTGVSPARGPTYGDLPTGYAAQVTGGTGTSALAQGETSDRR